MRDKDEIKLNKQIKKAKKEARLAAKGGVNEWRL
jgi:multiple sugar transport system permease protein